MTEHYAKPLDNLFHDYEVGLVDGCTMNMESVAISTPRNGAKTVFYDKNGDTVFAVSDAAMKYIRMLG